MENRFFILLGIVCTLMACTNSYTLLHTWGKEHINARNTWHALPARPYKTHKPVRLTIHHEGTKLEATDDAAKKIANIQRWGMGKEKNWADIPYHFLIAPNGKVYEGRAVNTVGETSTEYDPTGHLLICCLGNLDVQPLPDDQLQSLIKLTAWACSHYHISIDSIASHKDFSAQTNCPGKNLYPLIQNGTIKKQVAAWLENKAP